MWAATTGSGHLLFLGHLGLENLAVVLHALDVFGQCLLVRNRSVDVLVAQDVARHTEETLLLACEIGSRFDRLFLLGGGEICTASDEVRGGEGWRNAVGRQRARCGTRVLMVKEHGVWKLREEEGGGKMARFGVEALAGRGLVYFCATAVGTGTYG